MNWNRIRTDYPKAWAELEDWQENRYDLSYEIMPNKQLVNSDLNNFNDRDLFDFFDSKGVTCLVYAEPHDEGEPMNWGWDINLMEISCDEERILSRVEAEAGLFTRAFSILNEQLSKEG